MSEAAGLTVDQVIGAVDSVMRRMRPSLDVAVGPETRFADLGLDSLEVAEVFLELEDMAQVELDPDSARELQTVGDLTGLQRL